MRFPRSEWLGAFCFVFFALAVNAQQSAVEKAVAALQNGEAATAESILRQDIAAHPHDAEALGVLAVVLDQEHKTDDAGSMYRRAIAISPNEPALLNNYGNHLLQRGDAKGARAEFLKVEALEPGHPNASVQLARMALQSKQPAEADRYLARIPPEQAARPDVATLRMQADYALHRTQAGDELLKNLQAAAGGNAKELFQLGVALSSVSQYAHAETLFADALRLQPDDPDILHDLGIAASHAGHDRRAREVLQQALEKRPSSPDIRYDLAAVDLRLNDGEAALPLLVRAHQAAPERADIEFALAHAAADLGYFADALQAWSEYRKLAPKDEVGRREYAFCETAVGQNTSAAIADLRAYVQRHPADAVGHYELAIALVTSDSEAAARQLNRALEIQSDFPAARMARGMIESRAGDLATALHDFQAAAEKNPRSAVILDHLGETELQLDRTQDALKALRRAQELDPQNSTVLLHLGRALARAGDEKSASEVLARYRELGGPKATRPHPAGLVDFLALSPEEQQKRYRAGVTRTYQSNPENLDAAIRYLDLMLQDENAAAVQAVSRKIAQKHPDDAQLQHAASELLSARSYALASELISAATPHPSRRLSIDRAVALLHTEGPKAALALLDSLPRVSSDSDYDLVRAECLYADDQHQPADNALQHALQQPAPDPVLLRDAVLFLLSHDEILPASRVIAIETSALKQDPEWSTLAALVHALTNSAGKTQFPTLQQRWPEWPAVWYADAIAQYLNGRQQQARQVLQSAPEDAPAAQVKAAISSGNASRPELLRALSALFTGAVLVE